MARISEEERQRYIDDAYRAIGRYTVEFSELMREIRQMVAQRIGGGENWVLADIALGEAGAMQIARAFFGLCRDAARFTAAEEGVATILAREVNEAIQTRNDIAHGDWHVGYLALKTTGMEDMPPRLVRILPHQKAGPYKVQDLTAGDIDKLTDRLLNLLMTLLEFGKLALGLGVLLADERARSQRPPGEFHVGEPDASQVSVGEFRVGNVFVVRKGQRGQASEVAREGPRASELHHFRYR